MNYREKHFAFPNKEEDARLFLEELEKRVKKTFLNSSRQEIDLANFIVKAIKDNKKITISLNNLQESSLFGVGLGAGTFNIVCNKIEREISKILNTLDVNCF